MSRYRSTITWSLHLLLMVHFEIYMTNMRENARFTFKIRKNLQK